MYDAMHTTYGTEQSYDIVTCTEAIEHFHAPHVGGRYLTNLFWWRSCHHDQALLDKTGFASGTINDVTHVGFSAKQLSYLAQRDGYDVFHSDVVVLRKR